MVAVAVCATDLAQARRFLVSLAASPDHVDKFSSLPLCVKECALKMAQSEPAFRHLAPMLTALVSTSALVHAPHSSDSTASHPSEEDYQ